MGMFCSTDDTTGAAETWPFMIAVGQDFSQSEWLSFRWNWRRKVEPEDLVALLRVGYCTLEVDIPDFKRIADDTHVPVYSRHDHHHSPDGWQVKPEPLREYPAQIPPGR